MPTNPEELLQPYNAIAPDPRSDEEKERDYKHEEIAMAVPISWVHKPMADWKKYSTRNQDGSSSCCAQASAKGIETHTGIVESAHPIYRSRSNFPGEGMWLQNLGEIVCKAVGTVSEVNDPSQGMNEASMNLAIREAVQELLKNNPTKMGGYVFVNPKDIDQIAQAIELHKHCLLLVRGSVSEWNEKPIYKPEGNRNLDHLICAVDYFLDENNEKCVLIDDSWGNVTSVGNGGQRVITETYLKARFTDGMYFLPPKPPAPPDSTPHYKFTVPLTFGMMGNPDVKALQKILAFEGFFPNDPKLFTGNYLQITANCVKKWQVKHGIMDFANEINPRKIRFGNKSIAIANQLYNN